MGLLIMASGLFLLNSTNAKADPTPPGGDDWICCMDPWGTGCVDKGGVDWPDDIRIEGSQETCTK